MVRHYIVKGRVQGVGFRWLVHREAGVRGLKGWVRNTDAGEVEIMVAGSEEKLAELRAVLEQGSRGSIWRKRWPMAWNRSRLKEPGSNA
jgi:acylphosphatase